MDVLIALRAVSPGMIVVTNKSHGRKAEALGRKVLNERVCMRLLLTGLMALPIAASARAAPTAMPEKSGHPQIYAKLRGTTVLEDERVEVQRFIIAPGQATGIHTHSGNQLVVFVKGGVLTSASGRATLWPDGRVAWQYEGEASDPGSTNTGAAPIELLWITLKPVKSATAAAVAVPTPKYGYLNYPNLPGEDVLENDLVIVQRFKMKPGQWEGIHAHNPNTFYIFIKGGQWLSKSKEHPDGVPGSAPDGSVAWMDPMDISDQHQSGNTGSTTSDVVWVALKR
jgi:quercetin dioxygenase-like cupin family protein